MMNEIQSINLKVIKFTAQKEPIMNYFEEKFNPNSFIKFEYRKVHKLFG